MTCKACNKREGTPHLCATCCAFLRTQDEVFKGWPDPTCLYETWSEPEKIAYSARIIQELKELV